MNRELAQLVAVGTHGTAWLVSDAKIPPPLEYLNSTFAEVQAVTFALPVPPGRRRQPGEAGDVATWLGQLRRRGVERLWLLVVEPGSVDALCTMDPALAEAVGSGMRWALMTTGRSLELWRPHWFPAPQPDAEGRAWSVHYQGTALGPAAGPQRLDLDQARRWLLDSLYGARDFVRTQQRGDWADWFSHAADLAHGDIPTAPPVYPDMVEPLSFQASAQRLAAGASGAWIFEGDSAWNALRFATPEAQARHGELTRQLYATATLALLASANSDLLARR